MKLSRVLLAPVGMFYVAVVLLDRHPRAWWWVLAGTLAAFLGATVLFMR